MAASEQDEETRIYVADKDDLDPTFADSDDAPILQWREHDPEHGAGWRLWFLEPDGNGVESEFTAGSVNEPESAIQWARHTMRSVWRAEWRD